MHLLFCINFRIVIELPAKIKMTFSDNFNISVGFIFECQLNIYYFFIKLRFP